jgi:hypothetical protein
MFCVESWIIDISCSFTVLCHLSTSCRLHQATIALLIDSSFSSSCYSAYFHFCIFVAFCLRPASFYNPMTSYFSSNSRSSFLVLCNSHFSYISLYVVFKSITMFIYLNRLFISLVAMDTFCKSYGATDLASLHYVIFIESFAILRMEVVSFDFEQSTNNSIDKMIEEKTDDPFCSLKNISLPPFCCIKKLMKFNSKTYHVTFWSTSLNCKVSATSFVHNKFYHNKFILIIFLLQTYILKFT